jgi:hypothetical protein
MKRREFLKYGALSVSALALGGVDLPGIFKVPGAFAAARILDLTFTEAEKHMVVSTASAPVTCYYWCFKSASLALPSVPGPAIYARPGGIINLRLTNALDEDHAFEIPGVFSSGPIAPGVTATFSFAVPNPGTYLYYDNLNAPVNRMMGLHGAFIVTRPSHVAPGHRITPYANPTPNVQQLFDDLGSDPFFPGLAWEESDPLSNPPVEGFRQYVWVLHESSAALNNLVRALGPGQNYPAADFESKFQTDSAYKPRFFTISGKSGFFAHDDERITPHHRVGEPVVVRVLNAGLQTHSMHLHANHFYVLAHNRTVKKSVKRDVQFVDTFPAHSLDTVDWLVPFQRPPDIPNIGGIGLPDPGLPTINGGSTWPPLEELDISFPVPGISGRTVRQSPLHFPMHDHTEPSQTANGGNYPMGMISGIVFIGDRTLAGGIVDFPM